MNPDTGFTPALRRWGIGLALVALAACNAPLNSALESGTSYRNPATPIGVTSRFDAGRFAGLWQVRAVLPDSEGFDELALIIGAKGPKLRVAAQVCDSTGVCGKVAEDLPTVREGKGRYVVTMPNGLRRQIWVLWVDEGFRTAVVGNPAGTFAWILDRNRTGGTDRIKAAREILDFNGYDPRKLKVIE